MNLEWKKCARRNGYGAMVYKVLQVKPGAKFTTLLGKRWTVTNISEGITGWEAHTP